MIEIAGGIVLGAIALFGMAVALMFAMGFIEGISDLFSNRKHRKWLRQHPELTAGPAKFVQE